MSREDISRGEILRRGGKGSDWGVTKAELGLGRDIDLDVELKREKLFSLVDLSSLVILYVVSTFSNSDFVCFSQAPHFILSKTNLFFFTFVHLCTNEIGKCLTVALSHMAERKLATEFVGGAHASKIGDWVSVGWKKILETVMEHS